MVASPSVGAQEARFHEAAVTYLRLQLALGGADESSGGVYEAVAKDLTRVGAAWATQVATTSRLGLSRQHQGVIEAAAAAVFTIAQREDRGQAEEPDAGQHYCLLDSIAGVLRPVVKAEWLRATGPAAKRRKVESPWAQLGEHASSSPQWAVAAAVLLARHGHRVPFPVLRVRSPILLSQACPAIWQNIKLTALQEWVAPLSSALTAEVVAEAARTAAVSTGRSTESLKVLGLLSALTALTAALHSHSLLARASGTSRRQPHGNGQSQLQLELGRWRELAGEAMQWAVVRTVTLTSHQWWLPGAGD